MKLMVVKVIFEVLSAPNKRVFRITLVIVTRLAITRDSRSPGLPYFGGTYFSNNIQSNYLAMRLRLILERHSLLPVKVVWTVGRVLPPLANAGASYTISQLLEQINQTIPLQSDQWSLADYVVETGGFECLHFSQIDDVLNDDDEVR